jgi:hypothetical protein
MIDAVVSVTLTVSSILLFCYWFRFTCLLIVNARPAHDYAGAVAGANGLSFPQVQSALREGGPADLEGLQKSLDRDYALIRSLLSTPDSADPGLLEDRMLQVHYLLMGMWCRVSRHLSSHSALHALEEMSLVVAHFADAIGERAACVSAA